MMMKKKKFFEGDAKWHSFQTRNKKKSYVVRIISIFSSNFSLEPHTPLPVLFRLGDYNCCESFVLLSLLIVEGRKKYIF